MFLLALALATARFSAAFVHPGALHTAADIARVKGHVNAGDEPWKTAWQLLSANPHAQTDWTPSPVQTIYRGDDGVHAENYGNAYNDAAAAYQLALRWLISGNSSYADTAVTVLNAWSSTLQNISGDSDMFLASGLYGYQFANAAELMSAYSGWSEDEQAAFGAMLTDTFAMYSRSFIDNHNGQGPLIYYANWDLCNIADLLAVAIFTDNQTMYDHAIDYFLTGDGTGALPVFSIANYTERRTGKTLMQGQEAGRDQGHALLDFALLGIVAQQGYNQGDDLFSTYTHEILNG